MAARPVAVGGFVLGALLLGVIAVLVFGGMRYFTSPVRIVVFFPGSVAGLAVGAPVTFRGVRVGRVQSMRVLVNVADLKPVIPVFLDLEPGQIGWIGGTPRPDMTSLQQAVDAGLRAQLASQSLVTGQVGVDLDFHPGAAAVLAGAADGVFEIPTIPSEIQRLKDQVLELNLPELADSARQTLAGMQKVLGELSLRLATLSDSLQTTTAAAVTTLEATTAAVHGVQVDAGRTLANIDALAADARQVMATGGKDLHTLLLAATRTASQAEKLVDSVGDMVAPRSPLRGNLDAALRDLAASANSLRLLTHDLERNPTGTIFGRSPR
jgi:paraquat-inducible protein B